MSSENTQISHHSSDSYRTLLAQARRQRRLLSVHWELTHRCNERCTHCYLDVQPPQMHPTDELTTGECLRVLDQMAALGALYLTLSGGEVLLRRDWQEIATAAHAHRFVLRIFTNGLAITPAVAARLAAVHPYAVEISVYGADAAVHDAITRRAGAFTRTRRAFVLLAERGVRTVLKTPLMADNIDQFDALRALAAELGATFRYDLVLTPKRSGDRTPLRHALCYADLVEHYRRTLPAAASAFAAPHAPGCRLCNVGHNALVITPNGDIYPCLELPMVAGNVRRASLQTIWEEAPIWKTLGNLHADKLTVCAVCPLGSLCHRCHGLAHYEHGDLHAPSTIHCTLALARRQALLERGLATPNELPLTVHLTSLKTSLETKPMAGNTALSNIRRA
ncbi:MAG: radical SAM protein [Caldilineaceae bacterium]|nr:radical SAM protein [Caldilineaceae bacterium]